MAPVTRAEPITVTLAPAREAEERQYGPDDHVIHPSDHCGRCNKSISEGDLVRKVTGRWLHESCAIAAITVVGVDAAWLLLADQIIDRPSAYRAADIKTVMRNVVQIARRETALGGDA